MRLRGLFSIIRRGCDDSPPVAIHMASRHGQFHLREHQGIYSIIGSLIKPSGISLTSTKEFSSPQKTIRGPHPRWYTVSAADKLTKTIVSGSFPSFFHTQWKTYSNCGTDTIGCREVEFQTGTRPKYRCSPYVQCGDQPVGQGIWDAVHNLTASIRLSGKTNPIRPDGCNS